MRRRALRMVALLTASAALVCAQQVAPVGFVDTPVHGSGGLAGAINVSGWAVSASTIATVKSLARSCSRRKRPGLHR